MGDGTVRNGTRGSLWRSRWAALGAAVAVTLGSGGLYVANAAPGPSESTLVSVTPERILDTRDPNNVGLDGPFVSAASQKLQVTGSIPTAAGTKVVVPTGATGVLLNVTPVGPTADGFVSIRPGDATGAATTSSLNFIAGSILPNSVQVAMPTTGADAGKIDITFDAYGVAGPTTDMLIDVVGYTTSAGLQELAADVTALQQTQPFTLTTRVNSAIAPNADPYIAAVLDLPNNPRPLSVVVTSTANVFIAQAGAAIVCSIKVQGIVGPVEVDNDYSQRWESPGPTGGVNQLSGTRVISVPPASGTLGDIALVCEDPSEASVLEDIVLTAVVIVE